MDIYTQILCKSLVKKYKKAKSEEFSQKIRNELFCMMLPFVQRWLKSCLSKKYIYMNSGELLSTSWDAYCYCLNTYNNINIPIPSHFYKNINFFVLKLLNIKRKWESHEGQGIMEQSILIKEERCDESAVESNIFSGTSLLYLFRRNLIKQYRSIFDDVMTSQRRDKVLVEKGKGKYLPIHRYYEAKKVFKMLIKFLLSGDDNNKKLKGNK